ncbi:integrase catalytic domain-containing protein [Trichonephila clavipes]|nr:integrase catalytic domain-containing protein [Trichonephila clavipes]
MPTNTLRVHMEYVLVKSVGPKVLWADSRVQGPGEYFPQLQFHAKIVEVEIGDVAIYHPFGEFRRTNSYCHLSLYHGDCSWCYIGFESLSCEYGTLGVRCQTLIQLCLGGNASLVVKVSDRNWLVMSSSPIPQKTHHRCIFQRTIDKYSACVEVGKPIDENSACVEVGTTHKHLRRGEISGINVFIGYIVRASNKGARKKGRIFLNFSKMYKNALKEDLIRVVEELDGIVESTDTIVKLKTKIENSSTFESDPDFVKTLIQNCIDERVSQNEREVTSEQKIELAKLQLAKLEKEIELQLAKNKALSLNPAAKVEEKQFETNIENMIKSIKTLSLPVPTRSENFNLFFQSLERAFLTKKINDEYKSEILINLLGERAHNVLLYIKEEELNDYEKLKSIVLREFQLTPSRVFKLI